MNEKFENVKHFNEYDNWGNLEKVNKELIESLDKLQDMCINISRILIAPDKDAVYCDNPTDDPKSKLHNLGLAAKFYVSGPKLITFINMLQIDKIANITINANDYWKEKNLACSFDIDIRTYNQRNNKTITFIHPTGDILDCTKNNFNLGELMDYLLSLDFSNQNLPHEK